MRVFPAAPIFLPPFAFTALFRWDLYYLHNTAKCVGRASLSAQEVNVTSTGVAIEVYAPGGIYLMALSGNSSRVSRSLRIA